VAGPDKIRVIGKVGGGKRCAGEGSFRGRMMCGRMMSRRGGGEERRQG